MTEHAVIAYLELSNDGFGTREDVEAIHELSDQLETAIEENETGEFDGDCFGEGECILYMYGPDADALFAVIEPVLRASPLAEGARVIKRYGDVSDLHAKEVSILL